MMVFLSLLENHPILNGLVQRGPITFTFGVSHYDIFAPVLKLRFPALGECLENFDGNHQQNQNHQCDDYFCHAAILSKQTIFCRCFPRQRNQKMPKFKPPGGGNSGRGFGGWGTPLATHKQRKSPRKRGFSRNGGRRYR